MCFPGRRRTPSRQLLRMLLLTATLALTVTSALQPKQQVDAHRRRVLVASPLLVFVTAAAAAAPGTLLFPPVAAAVQRDIPDLHFIQAPNGLQYADAKIGTGQPIASSTADGPAAVVVIDYVMSTTGARYGSKIYSTTERGSPYLFTLGDPSTIQGLQLAVAGGEGIEAMRPGGIRRVILPPNLAYQALASTHNCQGHVGPVPPADEGITSEYYQRFRNIYCNPRRPYQPDLVLDIKLYGKR
jgi:FKBP-type peptidyl-prolyl cis-trans isomerase